MNYRAVYRKVCELAAQHLCSLEVYDEFGDEDAERVERAIEHVQRLLYNKADGNRTDKVREAELAERPSLSW